MKSAGPGSHRALRVVKVGGSLLDLPDLAARLRKWIARQTPACHVLLAGGGDWAEAVRRADRIHHLPAGTSHLLAVQAMSLSCELLAHLLPEAARVHHFAHLDGLREQKLIVFEAREFVARDEPILPGTRLGATWAATSDSIAGRLAIALQADELVLLKSTSPPNPYTLAEWSAAGYIDRFLPHLAAELPPLRCVDLRSEDTPEFEPVA